MAGEATKMATDGKGKAVEAALGKSASISFSIRLQNCFITTAQTGAKSLPSFRNRAKPPKRKNVSMRLKRKCRRLNKAIYLLSHISAHEYFTQAKLGFLPISFCFLRLLFIKKYNRKSCINLIFRLNLDTLAIRIYLKTK